MWFHGRENTLRGGTGRITYVQTHEELVVSMYGYTIYEIDSRKSRFVSGYNGYSPLSPILQINFLSSLI